MLVREDIISKERLKEIKSIKNVIESKLKLRLEFGMNSITAEGNDALSMSVFEDFIKAVNAGFPVKEALKIITENFIISEVDIERFSGKRKKHKKRIMARIIGREGSAKRTIEEMTNTRIIITDRMVYVLGLPDDVAIAIEAIEEILAGRKHSTAYRKIRRKARWRKLERRYEMVYTS